MPLNINKKSNVNDVVIEKMVGDLKNIYSNKSGDEYKQSGDITKAPKYESIEYSVSQLSSIKKYPDHEANALKQMFNTLHRPIFKKMVTEYLAAPDERNTVFTTVYTVGYRVLIGELARIFASSEATDGGFVYKPDKISKKEDLYPFIRKYNSQLEKTIDDEIKRHNKKRTLTVQEAGVLEAIAGTANEIVTVVEKFFGVFNNIFRSATMLNPVSLISALLSSNYDKKVKKYYEVAALYNSAKEEYENYMKIPASQRKKRIEHNYTKMIEKYNIKMKNLQAQIYHYDSRAKEEAKDSIVNTTKSEMSSSDTSSSSSKSTSKSSSNDNNGDFDF